MQVGGGDKSPLQKRSSAGPALGAWSGISGRNCWGREESHGPDLANSWLFSGACCCWELDLISHCRKCLSFSRSLLLQGEWGELIQANVGTNPLVTAGPDPIICSANAQAHQTIPEDLDSAPELPHQKKTPTGSTTSTLRGQKGEGRRNLPCASSLLQGKGQLLSPRQRGAQSTILQQSQAQPGHEPDPGSTQEWGRSS